MMARFSTKKSICFKLFLFVTIIFSIVSPDLCQSVNSSDLEALGKMIEGFPALRTLYQWDVDNSPCDQGSWKGINCTGDRVTEIDVDVSNDTNPGFLPLEIGNLTQLTKLMFKAKTFSTAIPTTIQNLQKLETLAIDGVTLRQDLPRWASLLTKLKTLTLRSIYLTDTTYPDDGPGGPAGPAGPGKGRNSFYSALSGLTSLTLANLGLTERKWIDKMNMLPNLETINLDNNNFGGDMGPFFAGGRDPPFPQLKNLSVANNQFIGLGPEFGKSGSVSCSQLIALNVGGNKLGSKTAPKDQQGKIYNIGCYTKLVSLDISNNQFADVKIPYFNASTNLHSLNVAFNNWTGDIAFAVQGLNFTGGQCLVAPSGSLACPDSVAVCCRNENEVCSDLSCLCSSNITSFSATTNCNNASGTWLIDGAATNNYTVILGQQDVINITGSLTQFSAGILKVFTSQGQGGRIVVGSSAIINGTLEIIVSSELTENVTIQLINASSVQGQFTNIQISQTFTSPCRTTIASPVYTTSSMSVLMSSKKTCGGKNNNRRTAIIVGVSVGAFLVVVVIITIIFIFVQRRGSCRCIFWARSPSKHSSGHL